MVHNHCTYSNQHVVLHSTAVYHGIVRNGNIVANYQSRALVSTMQNGPILNVGVVTDYNGMHITPYHCIKPNRAIVAHGNIAYDYRTIGQKTILTKTRGVPSY
jgi:hypothetical protein